MYRSMCVHAVYSLGYGLASQQSDTKVEKISESNHVFAQSGSALNSFLVENQVVEKL